MSKKENITENTTSKNTHRDYYNALAVLVEQNNLSTDSVSTGELMDFIQSRIAQLDAKNQTRKKKEMSEADKALAEQVVAYINANPDTDFHCADISKKFNMSSTQKATSMLNALAEAGRVIYLKDGKRKPTIYSIKREAVEG